MEQDQILKLDRAALALQQVLKSSRCELEKLLDVADLDQLQEDLDQLRQNLLGLEFGELYQDWDASAEEVQNAISTACQQGVPADEAAARVADMLSGEGGK